MTQTLSKITHQFRRIIEEEKSNPIADGCSRCGGLLVRDRCYDLSNSGIFKIAIKRCVQCGDVIDPMILKHRWQAQLS